MQTLRAVLIGLGAVAGLGACSATDVPAPANAELDEAVEAQRRLRVGKGDNIGSCADSCGGKSATGSCWCDDLCAKYGDCCDDLEAQCEADEPCFVGGCSSQLCTDEPGTVSTCDFKPEYACYGQHSACERQPDGTCGWSPNAALAQCLEASGGNGNGSGDGNGNGNGGEGSPGAPSCVGACGGQPAGEGCYCDDLCDQYGDCCADKVEVCDGPLACPPAPLPDPSTCHGTLQPDYGEDGCVYGFSCVPDAAPCFVGGCSGQLCGDSEGMISTCQWKQEYACYKQDFAVCERQPDGACGWTPSDALLTCIDDAVNACQPTACTSFCEHGFQLDEDGCETCLCNPAPNACEGHCGGKAAAGCWCDDACEGYGDCCPGKDDVCQ